MARPKSKDPIKTVYVIFRVTPTELQALRELARVDGRTVSDVARARIFPGKKTGAPMGAKSC